MGYHRHHAIVVTSWQDRAIEKAHEKATSLMIDTAATVTPISEPGVNNYRSFAVLPDGSKEGWDESDRADDARAALIESFSSFAYEDGSSPVDWVEVNFGGDDYDYIAVRNPVGELSGSVPDERNSE